jgi:hypothetical protein
MDLTHVFHLYFMHWRPRSLCDLHEALLANMSTGRCGSISARSLESEETDRPVAQATAIAMASEKIELKTQLAVDITTEHCPAVSDTPGWSPINPQVGVIAIFAGAQSINRTSL